MKQRLLNIAIAFDQFIYTLVTLGWGMPDETLSGAAWRTEQSGKLGGRIFRPFIDALFFFDPDHCKTSHEWEIRRAVSKPGRYS